MVGSDSVTELFSYNTFDATPIVRVARAPPRFARCPRPRARTSEVLVVLSEAPLLAGPCLEWTLIHSVLVEAMTAMAETSPTEPRPPPPPPRRHCGA